jgi:hypothetical protein
MEFRTGVDSYITGEGVEEGQGFAALGAELVGLVQDRRNPPLLVEGRKRHQQVTRTFEVKVRNIRCLISEAAHGCLHRVRGKPAEEIARVNFFRAKNGDKAPKRRGPFQLRNPTCFPDEIPAIGAGDQQVSLPQELIGAFHDCPRNGPDIASI